MLGKYASAQMNSTALALAAAFARGWKAFQEFSMLNSSTNLLMDTQVGTAIPFSISLPLNTLAHALQENDGYVDC